jgi:hypothetical protein
MGIIKNDKNILKPVLYTMGDSICFGSELDDRNSQRFSNIVSNHMNWVDCNNSSSGVSNSYMYRNLIKDVLKWVETGTVWSESTGWVKTDSLIVVVGWTAPTRVEYWDGLFKQDRIWNDYDKWGYIDNEKITNIEFVLLQTEIIPSYIRTFNYIISLQSILDRFGIPYYFFNSFFKYNLDLLNENVLVDRFGNTEYPIGISTLWNFLPKSFKSKTMYEYILENDGDFLERRHPSKKSHKIYSDFLIKQFDNYIV